MSSNKVDTKKVSLDIDICKEKKKEHIIKKDAELTQDSWNFLNHLPFVNVQYYRIWIDIDKIDDKLEIGNKDNLFYLKCGEKTGNSIENLIFEKEIIKYDIGLNIGEIINFKNVNSGESNVTMEFTLKGLSGPEKSEEDIKKYIIQAKIGKSIPEIEVTFAPISSPVQNVLGAKRDRISIGRVRAVCRSESKCVFSADLRLKCRLDSYIDDTAVYFGNPQKDDFSDPDRCFFDPDKVTFFCKNQTGDTITVVDNLSHRPQQIEFRDILPENTFYIPLFVDLKKIKNSNPKIKSFTLFIDAEKRCNTETYKDKTVMRRFDMSLFDDT